MPTLYSATFTFAMREVGEEFHALDKTIADAIEGYVMEKFLTQDPR